MFDARRSRRMHHRLWSRTLQVMVAFVLFANAQLEGVVAQTSMDPPYHIYLPQISVSPVAEIVGSSISSSCKGNCEVVSGLLRNVSSVPVYAVTVRVDFYDAAGAVMMSNTVATDLPATFPGDTNTFNVYSLTIPDHYTATITAWSFSSAVTYRPVTVLSITGGDSASGYIRNDQTATLTGVQLIVSYTVNGYYTSTPANVPSQLAPGETAPYNISLFPGSCTSPCVLTVQGQGVLTP